METCEPMHVVRPCQSCQSERPNCPAGACCCIPLRPLAAMDNATEGTLVRQFNRLLAAMRNAGLMER